MFWNGEHPKVDGVGFAQSNRHYVNANPSTLNISCYICFGASLDEAYELALLAVVAGGATPVNPVIPSNVLTTPGGDPLVTDSNDFILAL